MGGAAEEGRFPDRGLRARKRLSRLRRFGGRAIAPGARQAREVVRRLSGERQDPSARQARGRRGTPRARGRRRFVRRPARAGRSRQCGDRGVAAGLGQGAAQAQPGVSPLPQPRRAHGSGGSRNRRGAARRDFHRPLRPAEEIRRAPRHDRGGAVDGQRPLRSGVSGLADREGLHPATVQRIRTRGGRLRLGPGQRLDQREPLRVVHGRQHRAGQPCLLCPFGRHAQQRQHDPRLRRPRHVECPHHRRLQRSFGGLPAPGFRRFPLRPRHRAVRAAGIVGHFRFQRVHQPELQRHDFARVRRRGADQFRQLGRGHLRRLRRRRAGIRRAGARRPAVRRGGAQRGQPRHDDRVRRRQRGVRRRHRRLARHGQERHHRRRGRKRPLPRDHQRRQQRDRRRRLRHPGCRSQQRQRHRQLLEPRAVQRRPPQARNRRARHARHRRRGATGQGDGRQRQRPGVLRRHGRLRLAGRRHGRQHQQLLPAGPAVVQHLVGHQPFDAGGRRRRRVGLPVFPQPGLGRAQSGHGQGLPDERRPLHVGRGRRRRPVVQRPGHGHDEPRFRLRRGGPHPARPSARRRFHRQRPVARDQRPRRGRRQAGAREPVVDGRPGVDHGQFLQQQPQPDRGGRRQDLSGQRVQRRGFHQRRHRRRQEQLRERVPAGRYDRRGHGGRHGRQHRFRRRAQRRAGAGPGLRAGDLQPE